MPAPTDLAWVEIAISLNEQRNAIAIANFSSDPANPDNRLVIDVGELLGQPVRTPTETGVIKAFLKLLEAGRITQERINDGKPAGERFAAFPQPTIGNQANGYVPMTRAVAARADLSTVTSVIATTA